jgi:hypothetical protein
MVSKQIENCLHSLRSGTSTKLEEKILSIRRDARDYLSARQLLRGSNIQMNGWIVFLQNTTPFSTGLCQRLETCKNRYRARPRRQMLIGSASRHSILIEKLLR